ncbi:unnamed protein product [Adineta ricciae]|uniref:Centrosomal protein of 162 kDa n=1 Tax=Adineta ricciae TaxID=249248 RepID=A0A815JK36_ADIRI|nr:unnamed protein product [Adineta ricciae]
MSRSKSIKKETDPNDSDSDTSIEKYYQDEDSISSLSSSSTATKSSPSLQSRKTFLKKSGAKKEESKFDDDLRFGSTDENDLVRPGLRRPSNPLAKSDIQQNFVTDSPGNAIPDRNDVDGTPFSTMKFGSDTLDEEPEKQEFFRNFEENKDEKGIDYAMLNRDLDLDISPTRTGTVLNSFDKQINQMSTPLHHQPGENAIKESITTELDREIEHEMQIMNDTTTKHVTIIEPPIRPTTSIDDFSRTAKTASDLLTTTSDTTRDLNMLHNAYRQNVKSVPTARPIRTHVYDPKPKPQPQKPTAIKTTPKPNTQTPVKKASLSVTNNRPKTAPAPAPAPISKENPSEDAKVIEQLKLDKELLADKLRSIEAVHEEQLRSLREENYHLQAKITQLTSTNSEGKLETLSPKQREVSELEKLIDGYQLENERHCKQIKQLEQDQKQNQQSMFEENEKLRKELIHTKMIVEQYENSHPGIVKKQPSTILLTNLVNEDTENQRLKSEIQNLEKKLASLTNKTHEPSRSFDQRRIQDLERQVKELELINRRRQQSPTTQVGMVLNPLDERNQLTIKLHQTEETLREKQQAEEKLLQELNLLQEKYVLMKQTFVNHDQHDQVEKRIHDALTKTKNLPGQNQLRRENERLKTELEAMKTQQISKPAKSLKRDLDTIKLLRSDLERKNDELEKLRALYDAVNVQHKSILAEREREKTRLAIMGSKPYQPDRFTQVLSPVEVVHSENQQLKHLVEKLEHDAQQQHVELMRLREDRQAAIVLALREKDEENARLRQQHKLELQTLINEMANKATETRVTDLLRKLESQESTINHLKKLTEHAEDNTRELAILRTRDNELKVTIQRLEQELSDARTYHTPEMKHFQELQSKINQLEHRWSKRDQITKDYTSSLLKQHDPETNNDVNKLRAIIRQKNQEIERFHLELDSMLELLKTLKLQQMLCNH